MAIFETEEVVAVDVSLTVKEMFDAMNQLERIEMAGMLKGFGMIEGGTTTDRLLNAIEDGDMQSIKSACEQLAWEIRGRVVCLD